MTMNTKTLGNIIILYYGWYAFKHEGTLYARNLVGEQWNELQDVFELDDRELVEYSRLLPWDMRDWLINDFEFVNWDEVKDF